MSKLAVPRHKDQFVVTVSEPCNDCFKLVPVNDLLPKQRYVYGQGYVKKSHSCKECFDKEVKILEDKEAAAKAASVSWHT
jgi:hypothetical protein